MKINKLILILVGFYAIHSNLHGSEGQSAAAAGQQGKSWGNRGAWSKKSAADKANWRSKRTSEKKTNWRQKRWEHITGYEGGIAGWWASFTPAQQAEISKAIQQPPTAHNAADKTKGKGGHGRGNWRNKTHDQRKAGGQKRAAMTPEQKANWRWKRMTNHKGGIRGWYDSFTADQKAQLDKVIKK